MAKLTKEQPHVGLALPHGVGAMLGMRNARDTALARLAKVEAERDEARAVRANQEATIEDLSEALASAIDVRDELWAKLENACSERDGARAKLADVDRLLAIEEQAKRVARAEKWLRWARTADPETDDDAWHGVVVSAADTLRAERRKLAEMVGEGES